MVYPPVRPRVVSRLRKAAERLLLFTDLHGNGGGTSNDGL